MSLFFARPMKTLIVVVLCALVAISGFTAEAGSRRNFLGGACLFLMGSAPSFGGAYLLDGLFHGDSESDEAPPTEEEIQASEEKAGAMIEAEVDDNVLTKELEKAKAKYQELHPEGEGREYEVTIETSDGKTYVRTMTDMHIFLFGELMLIHLMPGIGHGSGSTLRKRAMNEPLRHYLTGTIEAPILEELLFRWLPRLVFGDGWVTGTVSSLVFGAAHLGNGERIPVTHFFAGLFFWHLMKNRGLDHAIIAHWGNNHTASVLVWMQQ